MIDGPRRSAKSNCPGPDVLAQFLTDELDEASLARVGEHIDGCEICRVGLDGAALAPSFTPTMLAEDTEHEGGTESDFVGRLVDRIQGNIGSFVRRWSEVDSATASGPVVFPGAADETAPLGRLDGYEVHELIGSGATGHLYKAFDPKLRRFVAIKILRGELAAMSDARARFVREAHAAANIASEHVVAIHEIVTPDDFPPYLVMQFIDGCSLAATIDDAFHPDAAARAMCQILSALSAAHGRGVIHRDVKPSNVLVEPDGNTLKLVDFGLARLSSQESGELTNDGVIAGTPAYMSPEQILDPATVDVRTDIYAAGVVLYELLTGERPFRGSVRTLLHDVLHSEPCSVRQLNDRLPRDLETICAKAMAKEASRRYQTAGEFRDDLQRYLRGEPIFARPVSGLERLVLCARRNPVVAGLISVLCIGAIAGLYGWLSFTLSLSDTNERLSCTVDQLKSTNEELRVARQRAEQGERRAEQHAELAEQQLNIAFEMVSALIFDVQDELGTTPGTEQLRRRLLARAMEGLERVRQSADENSAAELAVIMAESRLGDSFRASGSLSEAVQHYQSAHQQAKALLQREPKNSQALEACCLTAWNLGDATKDADPTTASRVFAAGIEVAEKWHRDEPGESRALSQLAMGTHRLLTVADDSATNDRIAEVSRLLAAADQSTPRSPTFVLEHAVLLTELGRTHAARFPDAWNAAARLFASLDLSDAEGVQKDRVLMAHGSLQFYRAERNSENSDAIESLRGAIDLFEAVSLARRDAILPLLIEAHRSLGLRLTDSRSATGVRHLRQAHELAQAKTITDETRIRCAVSLIAWQVASDQLHAANRLLTETQDELEQIGSTTTSTWVECQREKLARLSELIQINTGLPGDPLGN